ncbi:MAG: VanW family protein [Christensenellaceae bacterium]|jgi:vancomycin resistance protein YoaR|nr:VanW family protein [Christensenellaceae bacterium]
MSDSSRPPRRPFGLDSSEERPAKRRIEDAPLQRRSARKGGQGDHQKPEERPEFLRRAELRRSRRNRKRLLAFVAVTLLVLGFFAVRLLLDLSSAGGGFYPGVRIDDVDLGKMQRTEAASQLRAVNAPRLEALTLRFHFGERSWVIPPEQIAIRANIDALIEEAWALGREGNIFQRQAEIRRLRSEGETLHSQISYDENALLAALQEIKTAVDTPALDATVSFDTDLEDRFRITREQNGRSVDLDALRLQAKRQLENGFTETIELQPETVLPTVLEETLTLSTKRIVRTTTELGSSSEERIHNVKTALAKFNGLMVQPGEEVSFNKVTGERGLEQGYKNAGVIQDDEIVVGPGGGVCQVSTTLYQAVVKAGLQVLKSSKHSLTVSYVEPGTDAAVAWDYKDFVFKNNSDYPIFIEGRVSNKAVVIAIWGYPLEEGMSYEIVNEVYETIPAPEIEIIPDTAAEFVAYTDETHVKKKGRDGVKVRSYRVEKKNGEELSRELLRDDYYKEIQGISYVGVTPRPAGSTPKPSDSPAGA